MHSPYRKGRKVGDRRALLNAAAFQDHMARLVSLPSGGTGPVSSTGVPNPRASTSESDAEDSVCGKGHRLTLAQKFGLVSAPRSKLDEYEWMEAHARSMDRGDVKHGCAICYEPFRGEERVLLSCSHTFHKHCLKAFERFSKQRCCPLCRTLQYQKKLVASAREMYEEECAIVIQKFYRRHLALKAYEKRLSMRVPDDPEERVNWCAAKLTETNDRFLEQLDEDDNDIERLLADLDRKIFFSKSAREVANSSLREPAVETSSSQASQGESADAASSADQRASSGTTKEGKEAKEETDWESLKRKAKRRKDKTCPICIGPLARKLRGNVCLLSCSHMFHEDCIQLFELFQEAENCKPACPLCRANYEKTVIPGIALDSSP